MGFAGRDPPVVHRPAELDRAPNGIPTRVLEHLELSAARLALALPPSPCPLGLLRRPHAVARQLARRLHRQRRASHPVVRDPGRSRYVIVLYLAKGLAFGFTPTVIALVLLAIPPILTNTYVGVQEVDADTVEAARGMGMTEERSHPAAAGGAARARD